MAAIGAVVALGAVFALLRWLFSGRPEDGVRARQVIASQGGETELLTIIEAVPSPVQPASAPELEPDVPPHHAHDASTSHHAHDAGTSHHSVDGGACDGGGSHDAGHHSDPM